MKKIYNVCYFVPYSGKTYKHFESEADYNAWLDSMAGILFRRATYIIVTTIDDIPVMTWRKA